MRRRPNATSADLDASVSFGSSGLFPARAPSRGRPEKSDRHVDAVPVCANLIMWKEQEEEHAGRVRITTRVMEETNVQVRRRIRVAGPEEEPAGLPPPRTEGGKDRAGADRKSVV